MSKLSQGFNAVVTHSSESQLHDDAKISITSDTLTASASASTNSPTVSQFLNASNTEYLLSGTPAGMTAFDVNGKQLTYTNVGAGVAASVWETTSGQIIVAYQGTTGGLNLLTDPVIALTQIAADIGIYAGTVTTAETDSLAFAKTVESDAAAKGIASSNVFVTGHSLGGIEAEYVAQQTGLGGVAFESTGIPGSDGSGNSNFANIVTYGDPVGNYSSDIKGEQPFAPSSGLNHFGNVIMVGNSSDESTLHSDVSGWGNIFLDPFVLTDLVGLLVDIHLPGTQAHDLGVT